jgi:hypothetical protein
MITTTQTTKPEIIGSLLINGAGYYVLHADADTNSGTGEFICAVVEYDAAHNEATPTIGQTVDAILILPDVLITAYDARVSAVDAYPDRNAFVLLLTETSPRTFRAH